MSSRLRVPVLSALGLLTVITLTGCWTKSGEAVVLEKEYIPAAEVQPTLSPTPTPSEETANQPRELKPNEIVVEQYVMDKEARGTSKDPRATDHEQWIVRVALTSGGRRITVQAEQAQYEKLKPGDRVHVTYREGKYTGTIWSAEIQ